MHNDSNVIIKGLSVAMSLLESESVIQLTSRIHSLIYGFLGVSMTKVVIEDPFTSEVNTYTTETKGDLKGRSKKRRGVPGPIEEIMEIFGKRKDYIALNGQLSVKLHALYPHALTSFVLFPLWAGSQYIGVAVVGFVDDKDDTNDFLNLVHEILQLSGLVILGLLKANNLTADLEEARHMAERDSIAFQKIQLINIQLRESHAKLAALMERMGNTGREMGSVMN